MKRNFRAMNRPCLVICVLIVLCLSGRTAEWVEKPGDSGAPRLTKRTPATIPEGFKEMPYREDHLPPAATDLEKQQGFILFSRPITQAVHHVSVPREVERIDELSAFATPGELEPVNFAVYALRDLEDFRVTVSPLKNDAGREIPAENLDLRLVTEYPIGFPAYTSPETTKTYRWTPELLERVTVESVPSGQCRRYWIIMRTPADAPAGIYRGFVTMYDETGAKALRVPVSLQVHGFTLLKDPTRHYSVYAYHQPAMYYNSEGETLAQYRKNEYKAMIDYGLDWMPNQNLTAVRNEQGDYEIRFRYPEIVDAMMEAGLGGPILVTYAGFNEFYRKYVPGSKIGSHFTVDKYPETDEVYEKFEQALREFKKTVDKKYPEIIIGPIDEPATSSAEIATKALQAVQRAGFRSYMTVDTASMGGKIMREHDAVDVYCMQPYSKSFAEVMADKEHEYWLYPNHNATEIRDTTVMQKGGRMTYGYGHWRSGYKVLIPWHWRWVIDYENPFDYLRGRGPKTRSGSGNRMDEQGNVIPAIYWECFREGYDDYRYVYTLQQRVVEREKSEDPGCRKVVAEAREFLQNLWRDIEVQPKYLKTEFWDDRQFDAYRWQTARLIEALLKYPKTNDATAPTVIFDPETVAAPTVTGDPLANPDNEVVFLSNDGLTNWSRIEGEASFTVADSTDLTPQRPILRAVFAIDHEKDGGGSGKYPVGWPGVRVLVPDQKVSLADYDYVYFKVKIDSNRSETEDARTVMRIITSNHGMPGQSGNTSRDFGGIQRKWIPVAVPVSELLAGARSDGSGWLQYLRLYLFESDYMHGQRMELDFTDVCLLRSKYPSIERVIVPNLFFRGEKWLGATIGMTGRVGEDYTLTVDLVDNDGKTAAGVKQVLSAERNCRVNLGVSEVAAGMYSLRVSIRDKNGVTVSEQARKVEVAQ